VSDGTRTWNYTYSSYGFGGKTYFALDSVILPDTSNWQLGGIYPLIFKMGVGYGTDGCDAQFYPRSTVVGSMVHPTGATGTFTLKGMVHGRSDVPYSCSLTVAGGYYNPRARYFYTLSLAAKAITGTGLDPMTWAYAYGPPNANWDTCGASCPTSKTVSVTDPDGDVTRYTYDSREHDHIDPWTDTGDSSSGNIVDSCRTCNRQKGGRTPEKWGGQDGQIKDDKPKDQPLPKVPQA
jgi:YD repeat-containing protein